MLSDIYSRIAKEPISLTSDNKLAKRAKVKEDNSGFVVFQYSANKKRMTAFDEERSEMLKVSTAMFKKKTHRAFVRHSSSERDAYTKPMFDISWAPIIGALSQLLETQEDPQMVELCLTGFRRSIRLACRLDFPTTRSSFVNALVNFTALDTIREMKPKNVESIKLLILIAGSEGDYLEESWKPVLQCVSQLERLQLFGQGLQRDEMFFAQPSDPKAVSSGNLNLKIFDWSSYSASSSGGKGQGPGGDKSIGDQIGKFFGVQSRAEMERLVEESNAEVVAQELSMINIDNVFLNSQYLSAHSCLHFVTSLCEVSMLEISAGRTTNRGAAVAVQPKSSSSNHSNNHSNNQRNVQGNKNNKTGSEEDSSNNNNNNNNNNSII